MNNAAIDIWRAGVNAVRGDKSVAIALTQGRYRRPTRIIAVGKAAAPMARAAVQHFGADVPTLIVTKYGHSKDAPGNAEVIEAAHPVPDRESLRAGERMLALAKSLCPDDHLLLLISGGASSLAEVPQDGFTLGDLVTENQRLLSAGLDIHAMNARRRAMSRIKGGGLLSAATAGSVTVLAISDVEGDSISVIGSGIGDCPADAIIRVETRIIASNAIARHAAAAAVHDLPVLTNAETLYTDIETAARQIGATLRTRKRGVHIWGGEPTVVLPDHPGVGGRNQALSLLIAGEVSGATGLTVLAAGTDGTDGPTEAAGGIIDGRTWTDDAADALKRADSGTYLSQRGALFTSGPTGTNVMDLVIAIDTGM